MTKVHGEFDKINKNSLAELDSLYDFKAEGRDLMPLDLCERIAAVTLRTGREVSVYLNRRGRVIAVSVGDAKTTPLPALSERRGESSDGRLSGLRCIHTHPNGGSMPSSVDTSSLKTLKLDAMIVLAVEGDLSSTKETYISGTSVTLIQRDESSNELNSSVTYGPFPIGSLKPNTLWDEILKTDCVTGGSSELNVFAVCDEKAVLVGLDTGKNVDGTATELLEELAELAETAGLQVVHKMLQKRTRPESATYVGKGFAEEMSLIAQSLDADVIVFDDELSGAQIRNLEDMTGKKVVDRTTLILDIFAQRARSGEGKAQVELAQLKYRLPRLMGLGKVLSRLGGGIGTRGPGEKKLEVDRRHLRKKITFLEQELKLLEKRRSLNRETRKKSSIPIVAIVGYTNSGKSTLLNKLCNSDVLAENKLFATLDPTTRSLTLPDGQEVYFIDTVGFIRKLPHDLIEAFKSTLEEAVHCDLLVHVADISSPEANNHINSVHKLLENLGALDKHEILALNKCDLLTSSENATKESPPTESKSTEAPSCDKPTFNNQYGTIIEISAINGQGIEELLTRITEALPRKMLKVVLQIPFTDGGIHSFVHKYGNIISEDFTDIGYEITAEIPFDKHSAVKSYIKVE